MTQQDIHAHRILILDFGSQYSQLIARRVRELGVYCELRAFDMTDDEIRAFAPKGIILSGGPETVTAADTPRAPGIVFTLGVPVLGICYGMQTMAQQLGGQVEGSDIREFGYAEVTLVSDRQGENNSAHTRHDALFGELHDRISDDGECLLDVWMSHGDKVTQLPDGFRVTAATPSCPIAAMADETRDFYGVQFHPEVTHSTQGGAMLQRFIHDICQTQALWTPANIAEDAIRRVRAQVGDDQVLLGLSGGVDSSVVAALLHQAIGDKLTCVFVDNGLLRKGEGDQVMAMFAQNMGVKVIRVDAEAEFLGKLAGVSDPEAKRKIIGNTFIDVFDRESAKLAQGGVKWLAQGTIYPDVIESAASKTGKAHVIKSHHNVGGLPEQLGLKLLEPLRELFKDEVRELGVALGLPADMVYRHPFPGPGLGVRILGEIKPDYVKLLQRADAIFIEELRAAKDASGKSWYDLTSQAFTVFLPVKSVGVMGDGRTYHYVVALRAVQTSDFMTADWAELPYSLLKKVSGRIINEVRGINRVTYDVSSKPPATIEWE